MRRYDFGLLLAGLAACGDGTPSGGAGGSGSSATGGASSGSGSSSEASGSWSSGSGTPSSVGAGGDGGAGATGGGATATSSSGIGGGASSTAATGSPASSSSTSGSGGAWNGPGFLVDRTSLPLFEMIPEEYLALATELTMMFSDRSVGQNINESLNCLAATSYGDAPNFCRRGWLNDDWESGVTISYTQSDYDNGLVPAAQLFVPDPVKYNRDNWTFEFRQGTWRELTEEFVTTLAPSYAATTDVLTYQFSYLNVMSFDDIASPTAGFFADTAENYDIGDLEAFIAQHPNNTFIFWTTSLARSIGTVPATEFNDQMRQYAAQNGKILFDFADIVSHDPSGAPCYDNADGVEYCTDNGANCENHPDDGLSLPAICPDYSGEVENGHLTMGAARIRAAKAFWIVMARIAGWTPP